MGGGEQRRTSGIGKGMLARASLELAPDALQASLLQKLQEHQKKVGDVIEGKKHFLELVNVDIVKKFEDELSDAMFQAAGEISDLLLAQMLVDATLEVSQIESNISNKK